MTVQFRNADLMVSWMSSSVWTSTEAVASSRIRIREFRSKARAKHTSCRCPTLSIQYKHLWSGLTKRCNMHTKTSFFNLHPYLPSFYWQNWLFTKSNIIRAALLDNTKFSRALNFCANYWQGARSRRCIIGNFKWSYFQNLKGGWQLWNSSIHKCAQYKCRVGKIWNIVNKAFCGFS